MTTTALPPVTGPETWRRELAALRVHEKAATYDTWLGSGKVASLYGTGDRS